MVEKFYYSMGEVTEMFDLEPSVIRYWCKQFTCLNPKRNAKGNRMFTAQDIERLKRIYHLLKEKKMTIEGAQKAMRKRNVVAEGEDTDVALLERLQNLRSLLVDMRNSIGEEDAIVENSVEEPVVETEVAEVEEIAEVDEVAEVAELVAAAEPVLETIVEPEPEVEQVIEPIVEDEPEDEPEVEETEEVEESAEVEETAETVEVVEDVAAEEELSIDEIFVEETTEELVEEVVVEEQLTEEPTEESATEEPTEEPTKEPTDESIEEQPAVESLFESQPMMPFGDEVVETPTEEAELVQKAKRSRRKLKGEEGVVERPLFPFYEQTLF